MQYRNSGSAFFNSIPPIVKNLIIINILMLIASELFSKFMIPNFALFYPESPLFRPLQLFTHMFMHGDVWHLFFNMYALWIFGSVLEQYWGPKRFLTYYLITGIGAAGFYLLVQWLQLSHIESTIDPATLAEMKNYLQTNASQMIHTHMVPNSAPGMVNWFAITAIPMVGASGAIFGVLLAFGMLFPNTRLQLLFPPVVLKAKWLVIIYGAIELLLGFTNAKGDNIAHFAHIGGMIFGYLLIMYWRKKGGLRPNK